MKSQRKSAHDDGGHERSEGAVGFALPAVLLVLILLMGIMVTSIVTTGDERTAGRALRESARAFYAAEAWINATIADWDAAAYEKLLAVPGDSLVLDWQTLENGCTYRSVIHRVDGGDSSWRRLYYITSLGRGVGPLAGQRELGMMVGTLASNFKRALLVGGDLTIEGDALVTGKCPGAHSNGDVTGNGGLTIDGELSASGDITLNPGELTTSEGEPVEPQANATSIVIPAYDPLEYCEDADYVLRGGWLVTDSEDSVAVTSGGKSARGWSYDANKNVYSSGSSVEAGIYCVIGNAQIGGSPGTEKDPVHLSVIATGSVQTSGSPTLAADHPRGVGIMAGGDLVMGGSTDVSTAVEGLVYAGSQCDIGGKVRIFGQLVCRDDPNPPGSLDLVTDSRLRGSASVTFDCKNPVLQFTLKPLSPGGWYQRVH